MGHKFTKGFILGGLLMAAATVVFAMSKEGRALTKKLKEDIKQLTTHLKENLGRLRDVTKEDFDELVTTLVDEYAAKKKISDDSKIKLVNILKSKWSEIKLEYASEPK
jgi:Holliday junction resolvase RusA-like endonuclease